MQEQTLAIWCLEAHRLAVAKGFWEEYQQIPWSSNDASLVLVKPIALMHSEVSELLDAVRINPDALCDKNVELTCEEEEVADIFLRLVDYCGARKIDLGHAAALKHEYNKTRPYKHGKRF